MIPILVLTLACSLPGFARGSEPSEQPDWEVSGFGGGSFLGDFQFSTPVSGSNQEGSRTVGVHYAAGYQIGVRITENLGHFWGAGLEYSFANQPLRFTNLAPNIQNLYLSESIHHLSYNISYLPLTAARRFQPYGSAGIGSALFYIARDSKNDALAQGLALQDSWKFTFNWGGGFKYLVADQFGLTFDLKDQISGVPSYGLPRSARVTNGQFQPGFSRSKLLNNWQINFGIAFQFDD